MFKELVKKTRSFRRFKQEPAPSLEQLEELVGLTRFSPSAGNLQPLKYVLVRAEEQRGQVFSCLTWAAYLKDWAGPAKEERPTAYIIICSDPEINSEPETDVGLAAQTLLLGAREQGWGGCLLASIDRARLRQFLDLSPALKIHLTLALGTPAETVKVTEAAGENIRYWRDAQQIHYVPKRKREDLIIGSF
ncbi:MAG: nitroreductase [Firmicutes bacterium]|nr:nitroreductase [Bacillota bacterium]